MDDLTISIGSLGNYETLARCLHSIYQEDAAELGYQVWVVYNAPSDHGVTERIRRSFPQVRLLKRLGPLGYCATHNLILRQCSTRYVLLLDDDTILPRGTLSAMVRFMDARPDVGMAGPKTLNCDGTFQPTYGLLPSLRTELMTLFAVDAFWPARLYRETSHPREVEWLSGSFMLVQRRILSEVGILDEHYYTSLCEHDWCHRIRKAGWRVMFVPEAQIVHVGGEHSINSKGVSRNPVPLIRYHANRYYFFKKHYGRVAVLLLRPIMIVGLVLRLVYYSVVYVRHRERREVVKVRLRAFWESMKLSIRRDPYNLPPALTLVSPRVSSTRPKDT
jgi:GT2 family glycosyltransferase